MKEYPFSNMSSDLALEQIFMELEAYKRSTDDKIMKLESNIQQLQDELIKAQMRIQELSAQQMNDYNSKAEELNDMFNMDSQQEINDVRNMIL